MQLILNDYSLSGQFQSVEDDFSEYFIDTLRPILDILKEKNIPLFKKSDFYSRKITRDETVGDVLKRTGDPIFTVWKRYIVQMAYAEPYWDTEVMTKDDSNYEYPVTDTCPNCFTEALERKIPMFSFPHDEFKVSSFSCRRNGEKQEIENIYEREKLLLRYLYFYMNDIRYVIERYPYSSEFTVECAEINGKCHSSEALLQNSLNYDDYINIVGDMQKLWRALVTGEKTDLWDSFGGGLFEYRRNVNHGRIFRMFFTLEEKKICFLYGFIKKTQSTPQKELEKGRNLLQLRKKLVEKR